MTQRTAISLLVLLPAAFLLLSSCAKETKVGGGRGAVRISSSDTILDPRFSIFLSKAYFAVASRREAAKRVKLIKKGRRAARGEIVEPAKVKRGRRWSHEDTAWVRTQRQRLDALLATVAGENSAMFASAALAQANFDCWYYEMYKSPLTSRNSACALDMAAALGAISSGIADSGRGVLPTREPLPGTSVGANAQQGFATGQQFSLLQRYLEQKDLDTLLMMLRQGDSDMKEIVEKLVQQQLQQQDGMPLPVWQITFKGNKRKLSRQDKKTIKRIALWYKTQGQGSNLRIEASDLDVERVERIVADLVKQGVPEQALLYGEDSTGQLAGQVTLRAQRSTGTRGQ